MGQRASRDFEAALQNPAKCFETPQHVLDDHKLTVTQKRKLLEQWEQDARQLAVAEGAHASLSRSELAILASGEA